jgi:dihydroflavonol-4-reductase
MRVFVTGATGFFGGNLLRLLCDEGHTVSYLSRQGKPALAANDYPQAICREGDLCDVASLEKACRNIDWIFHAAAIVSSCENDRLKMEKVNVEGTEALFQAACQAGVKRFIYISTVDTIGIDPEKPIANENNRSGFSYLCNPYSDTKTAAENYLFENKEADTAVVIVNPGFMIGAFDTHGTSSRIVREITRNKSLFAPKGGNSFVDVKDVCRGALSAAEKGKAGERYILAGHNMTYRNFFTLTARLGHAIPPVAILPGWLTLAVATLVEKGMSWLGMKPLFTRNDAVFSLLPHYYSSQKAEQELGYHIQPLEPAIQQAIDWFQGKKSK